MSTSTLDIVRANFKARTDIQGELRSIDEAATADNREYTEAEAATIAEKRSALEAIDGRITANLTEEVRSREIEDGIGGLLGIMADRESGDVRDTRSIGERFTNDEYRSWVAAGARGSSPSLTVDADLRSVTDTTTGLTSGGAFTPNQRLANIGQDFLDRRVYLADLLPTVSTSTGIVEYVQDKTPLADMANKAVEVTEGSAKPQAGITTAVVTETAATIAAWANITRQSAEDNKQVMSYLDGRLRYSLKRRTDLQIIRGDGSSPNLLGLNGRTGILTYAPGSTEARYKSIRHAIRLMEDVESVPEIIVLNPADAELFDLSNETSAGIHAVLDASQAGPRSAWGLTQVRSTAIASGQALLIDPMSVAVFDREQATAYMTDSHASNFTSNLLTILLECRVGLGLFNPYGVLKLTFHD